ncbi:MAG TPA: signal peptidase II [Candidatus Limosilactobacillus merdigallinarum]|uniref:Lipoprotein signal peptidase n=1 Tax=Candidatus Limosilactobacillus merdigallinarum TaxID=2838652 RepID=A0A9D2AKT4_9LACO|nr:signal peptidase II [Candidatus Limosilactobacillus merdigallinarum]
MYAIAIICLMVAADQVLKAWVSSHIAMEGFHQLLPGIMGLTNLHNDGAAWSMLEGQQWFFALVSILAIAILGALLYYYRDERGLTIGLALIMAGTIGNFIDRLRFHYVVDMFQTEFINFPVFNVADACLTVGVIIIIIKVLREDDQVNGRSKTGHKHS